MDIPCKEPFLRTRAVAYLDTAAEGLPPKNALRALTSYYSDKSVGSFSSVSYKSGTRVHPDPLRASEANIAGFEVNLPRETKHLHEPGPLFRAARRVYPFLGASILG
jgi:hypothetical protein